MSRLTTQFLTAAAVSVAALALSACGGGSSNGSGSDFGGASAFTVSPSPNKTCYLNEKCSFRLTGGAQPYSVSSPDETKAPSVEQLNSNTYYFYPDVPAGESPESPLVLTFGTTGTSNTRTVNLTVTSREIIKKFEVNGPDTDSCKPADQNCLEEGKSGTVRFTVGGHAINGHFEAVTSSSNIKASVCGWDGTQNGVTRGLVCSFDALSAGSAFIGLEITTANPAYTYEIGGHFNITEPKTTP